MHCCFNGGSGGGGERTSFEEQEVLQYEGTGKEHSQKCECDMPVGYHDPTPVTAKMY